MGKNSITGGAPDGFWEIKHDIDGRTKKVIFDYLKENLQVTVDTSAGGGYYEEPSVEVRLSLKNPETGQWEEITGCSAIIR